MLNKDNIKANPDLPRKVNLSPRHESPTEQVQLTPEGEADSLEHSSAMFQAVGIINGTVNFTVEGKSTVTIADQIYPLFYISHKRKAFDALKREIERTVDVLLDLKARGF